MKVKQILEKLHNSFPPKEGCSNAILYTDKSSCMLGLMVWVTREKFMNIYLDSEDELDNMDKLIEDIKAIAAE
jgi:hypothetical protein